jgi:hypothetical protein
MSQEWPNMNRSLGSRRSTKTNDQESAKRSPSRADLHRCVRYGKGVPRVGQTMKVSVEIAVLSACEPASAKGRNYHTEDRHNPQHISSRLPRFARAPFCALRTLDLNSEVR